MSYLGKSKLIYLYFQHHCTELKTVDVDVPGMWVNSNCDDLRGYICEVHKGSVHYCHQLHQFFFLIGIVALTRVKYTEQFIICFSNEYLHDCVKVQYVFVFLFQVYYSLSDGSNHEPPPAPVSCAEGYTPYWFECFKLIPNSVTWYLANEECESQLAFLPSIHSDAENAVLHLMVLRSGSPVWLGLKNWEVCVSSILILYAISINVSISVLNTYFEIGFSSFTDTFYFP